MSYQDTKFYARRMSADGIVKDEIEHDLGLVIRHKGQSYYLNVGSSGELEIIVESQIVVKPGGSNRITFKQEG